MPANIRFYLRTIDVRAGFAGSVVYAVAEIPPAERRDPVPVHGGFPLGWRPIEGIAGIVHHDAACRDQYWRCEVPRAQFRHFKRIPRSEAESLYPGLMSP